MLIVIETVLSIFIRPLLYLTLAIIQSCYLLNFSIRADVSKDASLDWLETVDYSFMGLLYLYFIFSVVKGIMFAKYWGYDM